MSATALTCVDSWDAVGFSATKIASKNFQQPDDRARNLTTDVRACAALSRIIWSRPRADGGIELVILAEAICYFGNSGHSPKNAWAFQYYPSSKLLLYIMEVLHSMLQIYNISI